MDDRKRKKEDTSEQGSQQVIKQESEELTTHLPEDSPAAHEFAPLSWTTPVPPHCSAAGALPAPVQGGNNAKRAAVANGQPPSGAQRYKPREVPPRFRSQQDHKVLLKRGQPPMSCMLLGSSNSGETTSPLSQGGQPNASTADTLDPTVHPIVTPSSSPPSNTASATSTYANSVWGSGSASQPSSQGMDQVVVDGSDLESWPTIQAGGGQESKASRNEGRITQQEAEGMAADMGAVVTVVGCPSSEKESAESSVTWDSASLTDVKDSDGGEIQSSDSKVAPPHGTVEACDANPSPDFTPAICPDPDQDGIEEVGGAASEETSSQAATHCPLPPTLLSKATPNQQDHDDMYNEEGERVGDGDGTRSEHGVGPNLIGADSKDSGVAGDGIIPPPSFNLNTGASRIDGWEGGTDHAAPLEAGSAWGCGSSVEDRGTLGLEAWGGGESGSSNSYGVSQGAWDEDEGSLSELAATGWSGKSVAEIGDDGSSNSSSCRATAEDRIVQDFTLSATNIRALDNQKGADKGDGTAEELASQGSSEDGTSSRCQDQYPTKSSPSELKSHNPEVALQSMLSRNDLDPRVLCNTGWGQTQIQQNVAWDLNVEGGGSGAPANSSSPVNPSTTNTAVFGLAPTGVSAAASKDGWLDGPSDPAHHRFNIGKSEGLEIDQGRRTGSDHGWGGEAPKWGQQREDGRDGKGGECGDRGDRDTPTSVEGSGWAAGQEDKGTSGWKELGKGQGDWGQRGTGSSSGGWKETTGSGGGSSAGSVDEGSWGGWDEEQPRRRWRGSGGDKGDKPHQGQGLKPHPSQTPNSQVIILKSQNAQQQQPQAQPLANMRAFQESRSRPVQDQSPGWTSGPIPASSASEPSGWEEPSPQSISRKMDIDDGTSAWGDPAHCNKSVNMWDKNSSQGQSQPQKGQQQQQQQQQPPRRQPGAPANLSGTSAPASWGRGRAHSDQSSDNGTGTWGKAFDTPSGWGEPDEPGKRGGWVNSHANPAKSGSKSMQQGWGEVEGSMGGTRHTSWEEKDDRTGMWNNRVSQGNNSYSYGSGGWGQGHGSKRGNIKGPQRGGGVDSWMNPVNRQFSNMGMMDENSSAAQDKSDRRGMHDYNGDTRRGKGGGVLRSPNPKEPGPGETGAYFDKMGGQGAFGGSGGVAQLRGMHQPGLNPMNPSQGMRAQVPHQFLSPQVPGPMLKQMPGPSGGVVGGGMFPPPLSPQQLAMLGGIHPHMQQFQLAYQLLLQSQRKFPQPLRQQHDPQQLARVMALLQQRQQQQQQLGVGGNNQAGGGKLSPSRFGGGGPPRQLVADGPLLHPSLADLQTKSQAGFTGLGPGGGVPGPMPGSGIGTMRDPGGQQSRFKWLMEGQSFAPSAPETALLKNGPMSGLGKPRGTSPYSQLELLGGEALGAPPQGPVDSWHRIPGNRLATAPGTACWPPEFQPGVPWKGMQGPDPDPDPESDLYMTPGGILGSPGPPSLSDPEHQLLQDSSTGSSPSLNTFLPSPGAWPYSASDSALTPASSVNYPELKSSWPPEPIGHSKSWRANRNSHPPRPPPGLTNQKQMPSSSWPIGGPRLPKSWGGGGGNEQEAGFGPESPWSDGGPATGSSWLLLRNLTPQIDGSTLRTICMQHGPLLTFHLSLAQGSALIGYCSRQEAAKAQGALHMCVLGNTTILAEFVSEEEVAHYFAQAQAGLARDDVAMGTSERSPGSDPSTGVAVAASLEGKRERERALTGGSSSNGGEGASGSPSAAWESLDVSGSLPNTPSGEGPGLGAFTQWSSSESAEVEAGGAGLWGGVAGGYHGNSLWGAPQMDDSPAGLLPGNLLGGGADP